MDALPPKKVSLKFWLSITAGLLLFNHYFGEFQRYKFMRDYREIQKVKLNSAKFEFSNIQNYLFTPSSLNQFDLSKLQGSLIFVLNSDFATFTKVISLIKESFSNTNYTILFVTNNKSMLQNSDALGLLTKEKFALALFNDESSSLFKNTLYALDENGRVFGKVSNLSNSSSIQEDLKKIQIINTDNKFIKIFKTDDAKA